MKVRGQLRDQGACGSCWALAAVAALESHLRIKYGSSDRLSPQMLVSCMPNLQACGGTGGCQGATGELAFQYIKENGIPLDMNWPYTSFTGIDGKCNWMLQKLKHAQVGGYVTLPENKYKPLMNALYNEGPVVLSVDASTWRNYETGVFAGCSKDATINHAVLAEGYGEELMEKTKKTHKYFLIRNSWGSDFGENGYIRLERIENEASYSGTDYHPEEGTACKDGPKTVFVAGMCGMYYDSVYPTGVKFVTPMEGGTKIMNMNADNPMNVLGSVFDKLKPQ
jgi:cathepsin L